MLINARKTTPARRYVSVNSAQLPRKETDCLRWIWINVLFASIV
jgi:hypothetical protein